MEADDSAKIPLADDVHKMFINMTSFSCIIFDTKCLTALCTNLLS